MVAAPVGSDDVVMMVVVEEVEVEAASVEAGPVL